jgi:DNA repair exonuclease SbcCD ATPase subunit
MEKGIYDIDNFEKLSLEKEEKEKDAEHLSELATQLQALKDKQSQTLETYVTTLEDITKKRTQFVKDILKGENVQISINGFRDQNSFEQQFRSIIERESGFEKDMDTLKTNLFRGKIVEKIKEYRTSVLDLKRGDEHPDFTGFFKKRIKELSPEAIDRLMLLMPEDEIAVKYKPTGSSSFKPLTTASAGQKTTAILTFIMSHGECPLILDQPEDDLDNRLVYELVVDRLKKAKERRQIIVVTHNANIPVNGDAEHVISMDSNSKHFNVLAAGSVDQQPIKTEICDVMEGTEYAFNMRAKRYRGLSA